MVMKDADEGDELEVQTMDFETYVGSVVGSEVSKGYLKVELEGTGIDVDKVEAVSRKDDVWSRPRLHFTEREKENDRTVIRFDSTDLYGVFWP